MEYWQTRTTLLPSDDYGQLAASQCCLQASAYISLVRPHLELQQLPGIPALLVIVDGWRKPTLVNASAYWRIGPVRRIRYSVSPRLYGRPLRWPMFLYLFIIKVVQKQARICQRGYQSTRHMVISSCGHVVTWSTRHRLTRHIRVSSLQSTCHITKPPQCRAVRLDYLGLMSLYHSKDDQ